MNQPFQTRYKTLLIALFWACLIALMWGLDLATKFNERYRYNVGPDDFRLWAEQITSAIGVFIMVPVVAAWLSKFDVLAHRNPVNFLMLVLGSAIFSAGHFILMMLQRTLVYPLFGRSFQFGDIGHNLVFEYQKDIKIYVAICMIILAWRFWLGTRLQNNLQQTKADHDDKKLLVQTGTGETFINIRDILYIKSDRNYATIFTAEGEFLLRQTISSLSQSLPERHFVRVHRSYLVNLAQPHQIKKNEKSQSFIKFPAGGDVPVSKSYLPGLRNKGQL